MTKKSEKLKPYVYDPSDYANLAEALMKPTPRRCEVIKETKDEEYGKCVHCEKSMTKLEAEQSDMGNEDWDELTCDKCFEKVTLQIAEGAFPSVFA